MTDPATISVVVPAVDEAAELPATLASIERALGERAEIIVADGGSRDETRELAARHGLVVRTGRGRGQQLNAGARRATGTALLFLHADTHLSPGAAEALDAALADPAVVGGCFRVRLRGPTADRLITRALATAINTRTRWLKTATGDQAIFARRSAFEAAGGFTDLRLFEDVVFYRRLGRLGELALLDPPVRPSDRRWRRRGYLRTIVAHLSLRALWRLGVPSERLAAAYERAAERDRTSAGEG